MENNRLKHDASLDYEIPPGTAQLAIGVKAITGLRICGDGSLDYVDPNVPVKKPPGVVDKTARGRILVNIDSIHDGSFDYR